ncbi:MAG: CARDB domain-containing protein [Promethearchaeota archaeon]
MSILYVVFIFFSLNFAFYCLSFMEAPSNHERENEDLKNLHNQINLSDVSFDWTPIESIIDFGDNGDKQIVDNPNTTIAYDSINKLEILEDNDSQTKEFNQQIEEYEGLLDINYGLTDLDTIKSSYVFPPDDRQRIISTSSFPWRTVCKLYITAQNGSRYIASGAIIDNFHVLTSGHCVYLHDAGGWAYEIKVVPGKNGNEEPFGHAYSTYMRSYTGWTVSEMVEHDWAVLTLDRSIGAFTGWMGRLTADSSNSIYTDILNTAGYPGDLDYGENMYWVGDNGDRADEYNHWFWMDSAGGQSGSPVWSYDGENRYILSILCYEYINGVDANFGTRLNNNKFDQLNTWLSDDSSTLPNDKAELSEGDSYSNFSTTDVVSGHTNFEIYCSVKNSGTATASSFSVSFYASEDLIISISDYLIGTTDISILQPFNTVNADWIGVFPSNVPEGYYYIGLIIDSENSIDELNENNNDEIISYTRINVESPPPIINPINPIPIVISVLALVGIISVIGLILRSTIKKIPDLDYREFYYDPFEVRKTSVSQNKYKSPNQQWFPKFCTNCGNEIITGAHFCQNCGKNLSNI